MAILLVKKPFSRSEKPASMVKILVKVHIKWHYFGEGEPIFPTASQILD